MSSRELEKVKEGFLFRRLPGCLELEVQELEEVDLRNRRQFHLYWLAVPLVGARSAPQEARALPNGTALSQRGRGSRPAMLPRDDVPVQRQARDTLARGLVSRLAVERAGPETVDCDHRRVDVGALGTRAAASTRAERLDERERAAGVHHERGDYRVAEGVQARSHAVDGAPVADVHREDLVELAVGIEELRRGEPDVVADDHRGRRAAEQAVLMRVRGIEQRDPVCRAPAAVELEDADL